MGNDQPGRGNRMSRFIIGVMVGVAGMAVVLSGCANENAVDGAPASTTARPTLPPGTNPDDAYLTGLERAGLRGVGFADQDLITAATQACRYLGGGAGGPEVILRLNDGFSGQLSPLELSQLLGVAVNTYCPDEDARVRQELESGG